MADKKKLDGSALGALFGSKETRKPKRIPGPKKRKKAVQKTEEADLQEETVESTIQENPTDPLASTASETTEPATVEVKETSTASNTVVSSSVPTEVTLPSVAVELPPSPETYAVESTHTVVTPAFPEPQPNPTLVMPTQAAPTPVVATQPTVHPAPVVSMQAPVTPVTPTQAPSYIEPQNSAYPQPVEQTGTLPATMPSMAPQSGQYPTLQPTSPSGQFIPAQQPVYMQPQTPPVDYTNPYAHNPASQVGSALYPAVPQEAPHGYGQPNTMGQMNYSNPMSQTPPMGQTASMAQVPPIGHSVHPMGYSNQPPQQIPQTPQLTQQQKRVLLARQRQFGFLAPTALLNLMESMSIVWRQVTEERMTSKQMFLWGGLMAAEARLKELRHYGAPPEQVAPLEAQLVRLKAALREPSDFGE